MLTIARNIITDDFRRHAPVPFAPGDEDRVADLRPSPETEAIANEERQRIAQAIRALSPVQRQIVELRLIGMRSAEIAEVLDMSVSAVNTAHFRAYARLRDLLADADEQDIPR